MPFVNWYIGLNGIKGWVKINHYMDKKMAPECEINLLSF